MTLAIPLGLLPPTFPMVARSRGVSAKDVGMVMGAHPLIVLLMAPFAARLIGRFGPKPVIVGGVLLTALALFLLSFAEAFKGQAFLSYCIFVRVLQGSAVAATSTGTSTHLSDVFLDPVRMSVVSSHISVCVSIGYLLGPTIAGVTIEFGGFPLPCRVVACVAMVAGALASVVLKNWRSNLTNAVRPVPVRNKHVIEVPGVLSRLVAYCTAFTVFGAIDTGLEPELVGRHHLSPAGVGAFFALLSASYACGALAVGRGMRTRRWQYLIMGGLCLVAVSLGTAGVAPVVIGEVFGKYVQMLALMIVYSSSTLIVTPMSSELSMLTSRAFGHQARDTLAGLMVSVSSLGEIIGPNLGGQLLARSDFGTAMLAMGILVAFVAVLFSRGTPRTLEPRKQE
ncbi:Major facilitator superfamily (MFS) profile domain-containing protein [Plasmodiophora brassicae]